MPTLHHPLRLPLAALLATFLAAAHGEPAAAEPAAWLLSEPAPVAGSVAAWIAPQLSPDDSYVVFAANQTSPDQIDLYSAPADGSGGPVRLGGPVYQYVAPPFAIAPSGDRVVFLSGPADPGAHATELYSALLDGGFATRLSPPLAGGSDVRQFQLSPDGRRVVFSLGDGPARALSSVPTAGGAITPLDAAPAGGVIAGYRITPDSQAVVYRRPTETPEGTTLYRVPIDGGEPVAVIDDGWAGGSVGSFEITPDGQTIVFCAPSPGVSHLYRVPVAGGTPAPLDTGYVLGFVLALGGERAVYVTQQSLATQFPQHLYSVALAGGPATNLMEGVDSLSDDIAISNLAVAQDGTRVAYIAAALDTGVESLYSVPAAGGAARLLDTAVSSGETASHIHQVTISPDGARVLYRLHIHRSGLWPGETWQLRSAPIDGGPVMALTDHRPRPESVSRDSALAYYLAQPEGGRVLYLGTAGSTPWELFSIPAAGGLPVRVSGPMVHAGGVGGVGFFAAAHDGTFAIYAADQRISGRIELFGAALPAGLPSAAPPSTVSFLPVAWR